MITRKYMAFVLHDLTVHYSGGALLLSGVRINFSALFMSLWIEKGEVHRRRRQAGGRGFLILVGQGSSIWKFWSGGHFWMTLRSKPSDAAAISWAADENKETAFDMLCPSVCLQTNRMKGWPLIPPPRVLPFSHRPTALQPENAGRLLQRKTESEGQLCSADPTKHHQNYPLNFSCWINEKQDCKTFGPNVEILPRSW